MTLPIAVPCTEPFFNGFWGPFFTFLGALCVALIANFIAEDFKRFRDGSALAGAFLGELTSYKYALEEVRPALNVLLEKAKKGEKALLPEGGTPRDWVYESGVAKLGLLGDDLPERVSHTYGRLILFRGVMMILSQGKVPVEPPDLVRQYTNMLVLLDKAEAVWAPTMEKLKTRARKSFWHHFFGPIGKPFIAIYGYFQRSAD